MAETYIIGLDEVGRGPLAGPVVASAAILRSDQTIAGVRDSKALSERRRTLLVPVIRDEATAWGMGWVWQDEIDRLNILQASLKAMVLAMDEALEKLLENCIAKPRVEIMVDGNRLPDFSTSKFLSRTEIVACEAVIKGDDRIPAIGAASILAKVARDSWMVKHHSVEPKYGFDRHKGYPTLAHRKAITEHGPSKIQRMSFAVRPLPGE